MSQHAEDSRSYDEARRRFRLSADEEREWKLVKKEPPTREDWEDLFYTIEEMKRRKPS